MITGTGLHSVMDSLANPDRTAVDTTAPGESEPDPIKATPKGEASVPLSVLDLAPVGVHTSPGETLSTSTELAKAVEWWGFHRYWVAEHHGMPGIASSSPAVLIAHLAAATSTLRLGSGGVMLPNHPPLVVAEQFGTLQALHPGRIDLGLGRAPGTDQATARALRRTSGPLSADDFPQQLGELIAFLHDDFPPDHHYVDVHAIPHSDPPSIWLLGSSGFSAQVAGSLGLPFAFAHHFSAANTIPALRLYRESFQPSAVLDRPYAMICAHAIAAETDEDGLRLAMPVALNMLRLRSGNPSRLPTPQEAAEYPFTDRERVFVDNWLADSVYGSAETVRADLDELVERTGADELMITANVADRRDRLRSYELIAQAYRMPNSAIPAA